MGVGESSKLLRNVKLFIKLVCRVSTDFRGVELRYVGGDVVAVDDCGDEWWDDEPDPEATPEPGRFSGGEGLLQFVDEFGRGETGVVLVAVTVGVNKLKLLPYKIFDVTSDNRSLLNVDENIDLVTVEKFSSWSDDLRLSFPSNVKPRIDDGGDEDVNVGDVSIDGVKLWLVVSTLWFLSISRALSCKRNGIEVLSSSSSSSLILFISPPLLPIVIWFEIANPDNVVVDGRTGASFTFSKLFTFHTRTKQDQINKA